MNKPCLQISIYSLAIAGLLSPICDVFSDNLNELRTETLHQLDELKEMQRTLDNKKVFAEKEIASLKEIAALQNQEIQNLQNQMQPLEPVSCTATCPPIFDDLPSTDEVHFYIEGDYLLWKTIGSALPYAIADQISNIPYFAGNLVTSEYDWDSGYRLNLGFTMPDLFWSLDATYTGFQNRGGASINNDSVSPFPVTLVAIYRQASTNRINSAAISYKLDYNTLDLLLGRNVLLGDDFILKFMVGGTGAWIHQNSKVDYFSENLTSYKTSFHFNGGGFKTGLASTFYIGKGFNIFSQLALSGLIGKYTNSLLGIIEPGNGINANEQLKQTWFAISSQILIGPSWGFMRENWGFNLKAEYEMNPWFNINLSDLTFAETNISKQGYFAHGLLCPQGLTVSLNLIF